MLLHGFSRHVVPALMEDAADVLVDALVTESCVIPIGDWAEQAGLARETLSPGFARLYGVSPSCFRAELRARAAWLRISGGHEPLAAIAND